MTPAGPSILLLAASAALAEQVEARLAHHRLRTVYSVVEAIAEVKSEAPDVLLCDARAQPFSAEELLDLFARYYPRIRGVTLTPAGCDEILATLDAQLG